MSATTQPADDRATFNQVYWDELCALRPELKKANPNYQPASFDAPADVRASDLRELYKVAAELGTWDKPDQALSALCLSGGGIRSATFNLGVLQALARCGLLGKFDYLSSVSGGGYIASWLQAWIGRTRKAEAKQKEMEAVEASASTEQVPVKTASPQSDSAVDNVCQQLGCIDSRVDPLAPEPPVVKALREHSNYLTPKLGLFSGDTWALAAVTLRNMLLNWMIILPLLASVVALPQLFYLFVLSKSMTPVIGYTLLVASLLMELAASWFVYSYRRFGRSEQIPQMRYVVFCVLPIVGATALLCAVPLGLHLPWKQLDAGSTWYDKFSLARFSLLWCAIIPFLGWTAAEIWYRRKTWPKACSSPLRREACEEIKTTHKRVARYEIVAVLFSGLVAAGLLYAMTVFLLPVLMAQPELYVVFGLPSLLALYLFARILFVAIASLSESRDRKSGNKNVSTARSNDQEREWWARLSGWVLAISVGWIAVVGACLFGQYILGAISAAAKSVVAAAGGLSGLAAALLASRDKTSHSDSGTSTMQGILLATAAPAFVLAVIFVVAWGNAWLGGWLLGKPEVFMFEQHSAADAVTLSFANCLLFLTVFVGFFLFAWLAGRVVNVNRFSLHGMYRNRLVRAYLGASNSNRHADPFTGFAPDDNMRMSELRASSGPQKLLPIINLTLNLVNGEKLAWQQRKAESFSVSPYYCGAFGEGYRRSEDYAGQRGISLGTAITISGAAANPNMGYCSSPALGFVMTLFNARLGAWLGNTNQHGAESYRHCGPSNALIPILKELFGLTNNTARYVNLSDGGHFDNLGLYEVVLRRCRFVLVCDSGRDGDYTFGDLGNAIRKIRIDFGIPIDFADEIRIVAGNDKTSKMGMYCATATICYDKIDPGASKGHLIYLKPTMGAAGKPPPPYDIYSYWRSTPEFPHESTADQWFDESQFESYRMLGCHAVRHIVGGQERVMTLKEFADYVEAHLCDSTLPASNAPAAVQTPHVPGLMSEAMI